MTPVFDRSELLIVLALPDEAQGHFDTLQSDVVFTGIGKINAAHALTRRLTERRATGRLPRLVLNFGTAGSGHFDTGSLVACRRFVQGDMDARALGFELGHTPFESGPHELVFPALFAHLPEGVCSSADRFDTSGGQCEVVDMEAYALAKVCRLEEVAFACAKYITDGADHNAATDWHASLPRAAEQFVRLFESLVT